MKKFGKKVWNINKILGYSKSTFNSDRDINKIRSTTRKLKVAFGKL